MKAGFVWMCVLTFAVGLVASGQDGTVVLPRGGAIVIDGKLSAEEWQEAVRQDVSGGGELRLRHDGEFVYVGARGAAQSFPHLCVFDGRVVRVLHASASLGTAIYQPGEKGEWKLEQGYAWALRDGQGEEKTRAAFLEKHGWLANTMGMGNSGEFEFKIARRLFNAKEPRLALAWFAMSKTVPHWPAALRDDSLKGELLMGQTPVTLKFDPTQWAKIKWN